MSKTPDFADILAKATEQFRVLAEKGIEQSKDAYDKLKSSADGAQKSFQNTVEASREVSSELSLKAIAALRINADLALAHIEHLAGAKTPSEVVELQTAYLRRHAELTIEQAKEFQALATKAAEDVSGPIKAAFQIRP